MQQLTLVTLWPLMACASCVASLFFLFRPPVPAFAIRAAAFVATGCAALSVQGAALAGVVNLWAVGGLFALLCGSASAALFWPGSERKEMIERFIGSFLIGGVASVGVITRANLPVRDWIWICGGCGFFGWGLGTFGGTLNARLARARNINEAKKIFTPDEAKD